jgi:ABC-type dipeptide/oligopeptide/nickel transport system permease subunit
MRATPKRRPTISKAQSDADFIYVDRGRGRPKGWVLAHNHTLHASTDDFARMKRRSLRMSVALGLAIGFAGGAITIHLATTIGLLLGYLRP